MTKQKEKSVYKALFSEQKEHVPFPLKISPLSHIPSSVDDVPKSETHHVSNILRPYNMPLLY